MTDFTTALNALESAQSTISNSRGIKDCTFDCDNDSAEIIFTAGKTEYILKLEELND